jgi:uncharacterized protein (DUF697 family)
MPKIFGREPAAWAGLLQGVLAVALAFGLFGLTNEKTALIQAASAALFAVVAAWYTKKVNTAVVVAAVQAVLALLVGYGLDIQPDQTAALIGAVQIALAGFLRQNTEPAIVPGFDSEPLTGEHEAVLS